MKSNICNVSVLSEPDLELLSNMDPNHVADVTGKDFIEQLKEASGRLGGGDHSTDAGFSPSLSGCLSVFFFYFIIILSYTCLKSILLRHALQSQCAFECTNDDDLLKT